MQFMRTTNWLVGICSGAAFCMAGLVLLTFMVRGSCGLFGRTDYVGSIDEAFANNSPPVQVWPGATTGADAVIEGPYGLVVTEYPLGLLGGCNYPLLPEWVSVLIGLASLVVMSISGALGTRLGQGMLPWRGAGAAALGALLFLVISSSGQPIESVVVTLIALIAAVMGYIGGWLTRSRARA